MSKSVGNVVDPFALVDHYGLDQVRYFFLREVPFGQDGSYSHEAIVNRTNADLANDLGNLAQRSLSMIAKNCDGLVPKRGALQEADSAILDLAAAALGQARKAMAEQAIHVALAAIFGVVAEANRYFAGQEPWALRKSDPARMETVLYTTAEMIRRIGILCQPYIPGSAAKLLDLLAVPAESRSFANLGAADALVSGTKLPAPEPVFPRYVEDEAAASDEQVARDVEAEPPMAPRAPGRPRMGGRTLRARWLSLHAAALGGRREAQHPARATTRRPERRLVASWLKGDRAVVELGGAFGIVSGVIGARLQRRHAPRHRRGESRRWSSFAGRNAAAARPAGRSGHR